VKSTSQKDIAKKLGKKVTELRKDKNLSQADLCYEAEIDISTLSRLERGQLNVTLSVLQAISKTLSVEMKDLFDF
jgi:transcriptional regulator with XRE-family HTH domain